MVGSGSARCNTAGVKRIRALLVLAGAALLAGSVWWRRNPSPIPYWQRLFVELPHPGITRSRLIEILEPRPGEHLLEVGPGTGYYSLPVAEELDDGRLEIFDVQREMLDHVLRAAGERGLRNLVPWESDAREMLF